MIMLYLLKIFKFKVLALFWESKKYIKKSLKIYFKMNYLMVMAQIACTIPFFIVQNRFSLTTLTLEFVKITCSKLFL